MTDLSTPVEQGPGPFAPVAEPSITTLTPKKEEPDFGRRTLLKTGMELENPMVAAWSAVTQEEYEPDQLFTRERHLELLNDPRYFVPPMYTSTLIRARSEKEFYALYGKVQKTVKDRQFLQAQGAAGTAVAMFAGVLSPTLLFPAGAAGSLGMRVLTGAMLGATGEAIDEAALQAGTLGRSGAESVVGVGIGAVVGGMLGPFAGRVAVDQGKFAEYLAGNPAGHAMTPYTPGNLSAAGVAEPRRAKSALGLGSVLGKLNPVNRALFQKMDAVSGNVTYNAAQQQLSHGGLILEGVEEGRTVTRGLGTVEAEANTYNGYAYQGIRSVQDGYTDYLKGLGKRPTGSNMIDDLQMRVGGGGLSYPQYERELMSALANGDAHANPAIAAAAKKVRMEVYDPIFAEGKAAGVFDEVTDLGLDSSYVTRNWDRELVASSPTLPARLQNDFITKLRNVSQHLIREHKAKIGKIKAGPEAAAARKTAREELKEALEELGAAKVDMDNLGALDFTAGAREAVREVIETITSSSVVPGNIAVLRSKNARRIARVLDVKTSDYLDVIDTNLENNLLKYTQTMGADISLIRRYGDVTGENTHNAARQEYLKKRDNILALERPEAEKSKLLNKLQKQFDQLSQDHTTQINRLRGVHGAPSAVNGLNSYGRTARHVANAALLGGAGVASMVEIGTGIIEHGIIDSFRHGLVPLFTAFDQVKLQKSIARSGGLMVDGLLHTRASKLTDDLVIYQSMSGAERLAEGASRKVIQASGLHFVTDTLQGFNASILINKTFRDIETLVTKPGTVAAKRAAARLGRDEIDEATAGRWWKQINAQTAETGKVNGVWTPSLDEWNATEARAFRAMMNRSGQNTVVVPGLELPNWSGSNEMARVLGQFSSFVLSSTNKIMLRSAQKRDADVVFGVMTLVALGMLGDYFKALYQGRYSEYQELSLRQRVGRGIGMSGVLGVFSYPVDVFTSPNKVMAASRIGVGASIGLAAGAAGSVANIIDPGTDMSRSDLSNVVRTVPGSNLPALAWAFGALKDSAGDALGLDE